RRAPDRRRRPAALRALTSVPGRMTATRRRQKGRLAGLVAQMTPASWVTLAVGVAALAIDSFAHDTPVALVVTLAAVALALDFVDGWLARRTGTATAL